MCYRDISITLYIYMIYLLPEDTALCKGGWNGRNPVVPGGDLGSCPARLLLPLPALGSPLSLSTPAGCHNFGTGRNTDGMQ